MSKFKIADQENSYPTRLLLDGYSKGEHSWTYPFSGHSNGGYYAICSPVTSAMHTACQSTTTKLGPRDFSEE